jgi:hypothetical protein
MRAKFPISGRALRCYFNAAAGGFQHVPHEVFGRYHRNLQVLQEEGEYVDLKRFRRGGFNYCAKNILHQQKMMSTLKNIDAPTILWAFGRFWVENAKDKLILIYLL